MTLECKQKMSNINDISIKEGKFDKFVFWACIIDSFFLPYFWLVSVPYAMPLLFYWFFKRHRSIKEQTEYIMFKIMFSIMCFSTLLGLILEPKFIYENIVFLIQHTSIFLYYFMVLNYIKKNNFNIKKILIIFILFVVILAVIFNIDIELYNEIFLIWNARAGTVGDIDYMDFIGYRYIFIWMDPNNVAYMLNAVVLYLWCNEKTGPFIKVFSLLSLIFILISCMSSGGFITLGIVIVIYLLVKVLQIFKDNLVFNTKIKLINIFIFMVTVVALIYLAPEIPKYFDTSVAVNSEERIRNNSGDSRFRIWEDMIENTNFFEYILLGKGGLILKNGNLYSPHNGHFYWILSYGFISYCIFMYILFRKRKITPLSKYIWIIPILFGFTVNILIGELKLMGIILLLIACSSSELYLNNTRTGEQSK